MTDIVNTASITASPTGGTSFNGREAVEVYRATVIAHGLRLYARTGIRPNRAYTPTNMMAAAAQITGQKFGRRDYMGAYEALMKWAKAQAALIAARNVCQGVIDNINSGKEGSTG